METIVIKMGGVASDNLTKDFFKQLRQWQAQGKKIVIVHGGGHYISEMMVQMKLPVNIKNGLRVTDSPTLEITRMVLLGKVQPMITTCFQKAGFQAIGLNAGCDQLICGETIDTNRLGYVGNVKAINHDLLEILTKKQHIPIIAPLGITEEGQWLNINADEVASHVAISLKAETLFLLTDVPGIKQENEWLPEINFSDIETFIKKNIVHGGMVPKLLSAKKALENGVRAVHVTNAIGMTGTKIHPQTVDCYF